MWIWESFCDNFVLNKNKQTIQRNGREEEIISRGTQENGFIKYLNPIKTRVDEKT